MDYVLELLSAEEMALLLTEWCSSDTVWEVLAP